MGFCLYVVDIVRFYVSNPPLKHSFPLFLWWPENVEVGHSVLFGILPITEVRKD